MTVGEVLQAGAEEFAEVHGCKPNTAVLPMAYREALLKATARHPLNLKLFGMALRFGMAEWSVAWLAPVGG